jgi:ATP-binding cassette subfamily F protein uup
VTLGYGEKKLLENVTWRIGPGDRLAVVGVNGAGKSTLLRLLAGELQAMAGHIAVGQTVKPAYLSQLVAELDPRLRVLEAVEEVGRYLAVETGGSRELTAGQLLESFGFAAAKQWTRVGDLSGGERRRLQILRLLLGGANVLLLDEPTNDLDIETLQALEDVLDGWPGTLIVVSHDRYFVERVADSTMALLGDGSLRQMIGGIDEYLERRAKGGVTPAVSGEPVPAGGNSRGGDTRVDEKARGKELTRLERLIVRLDKREKALHEKLAEAAADHAKATALDTELREVLAEKISAEDAWLELAEG